MIFVFISDCEAEKQDLRSHNSQLSSEIQAQRSQIENLSTRLASLARLQQTLVTNGQIDQDTINRLVTNIRAISQVTTSSQNMTTSSPRKGLMVTSNQNGHGATKRSYDHSNSVVAKTSPSYLKISGEAWTFNSKKCFHQKMW